MRASGTVTRHERLSPGDHLCWVVDERDDYAARVREWASDGLRDNDKVFVFGPHASLDASSLPEGVTVLDPSLAALQGGSFHASPMFEMFDRERAAARGSGARGVRVLADMDWLLPSGADPRSIMLFELFLDELVAEHEDIVVCAYHRDSFGQESISRTCAVHPLRMCTQEDGYGFAISSTGPRRWAVSGELDFCGADAFAECLDAIVSASPSIELDCRGLRFVDVAGMRAVARVADARPDVCIDVVATSRAFMRGWTLMDYARSVPSVHIVREPGDTLVRLDRQDGAGRRRPEEVV